MSDDSGVTGESMVTVICQPCMVCGKQAEVQMPLRVAEAIRSGEYIQRAWPEASADTREMVISGTHPDCWEQLAGGEEEEDEDDSP
jgi:hypothetical protein